MGWEFTLVECLYSNARWGCGFSPHTQGKKEQPCNLAMPLWSQGWLTVETPAHPVFHFAFCGCDEMLDPNQHFQVHCPWLREVRTGTQSGTWRQERWRYAYWLALWLMPEISYLDFLFNPGPSAQGRCYLQWAEPSHLSPQPRGSLTDMATGQVSLIWEIPQWRFVLLRWL